MALIKCGDCEKEYSDKAKACPNCGCPNPKFDDSKVVKIKLGLQNVKTVLSFSKQPATITKVNDGAVLYEGKVGDVAKLEISEPIEIEIKYAFDLVSNAFGGKCTSKIEPGKKYSVIAKTSFMSQQLTLQEVDIIDAD